MGTCEKVIYLGSRDMQHTQNTAGISAFEKRTLTVQPGTVCD